MTEKTITDWKIVPTTGNTVSLIGRVNGEMIQTSPIVAAKAGEVKTKNSHYFLKDKLPGVWEIQLEMRRKSQVENLRKYGVL